MEHFFYFITVCVTRTTIQPTTRLRRFGPWRREFIHVYEDQVDLNFENLTARIKENYLDLDPTAGIEIDELLEVDGSWPLPQQFSVKCLGASKPRLYNVNPSFRPKIKNPVWDSGTLLYAHV